jgi:uncharacterized repeat protein (TIGR01451 family)
MKHFFTLFIVIATVKVTLAQSISINHQFQGTSPSALSKGNHKMGWVTLDSIQGNPYTYNYMDSLQNITSFVDTNISIPSDSGVINGVMGSYIFEGDQLFVTQMDPNGHLWGLFFDWDINNGYYDSSSVNFNIPLSCYFLYDFDNHQRNYLNVNPIIGAYSSNYANHKINFLSDTIYVTIDLYDFWLDSKTICIKWSNGTIISYGNLFAGNNSTTLNAFIDQNSKLTSISTSIGVSGVYSMLQSEGLDANGNPIGYHQNILFPTYPNLYAEVYATQSNNNSTYLLGYLNDDMFDTITAQGFPCVSIMNNAFDTIIPIPTGFLPQSVAMCVDHLDRIWLYLGDSIFMYDGSWIGFSLQGFSPFMPPPSGTYYLPEVYFIEYAENKFMISADGRGVVYGNSRHGDGILFINYNEPAFSGLNHVQGKVFYDSNNNGIYDSGEYPIINQIVNAGAVNANVYLNGNYNLYLANGAQTVITTNVLPNLTSVPTAHNFNFNTPTDTSGINFAMQHIVPTNDLRVDLTAGIHRTFQENWYFITYKNTGSASANGTVTVQFDSLMSLNNINNSNPAPTTSSPGNLTWDFSNLQPFETRHVYFYLSTNNNFNIGDTVYAQASITPLVGDAAPANNTDSTMSIFVGAYDPNMKVVTQNGAEVNTILNDDPLEYVIHFQNVGNDTAFTVVITDTISNLLDLSSLEIIGSSHANYWGIYNRTLQFTFNGINLPDSGTNQLASNGFVSYRIKPVANISMGNVINNTAAIYFDVNAPVITNNAQVTLIDVTGIKEDDAKPYKSGSKSCTTNHLHLGQKQSKSNSYYL